MLVVWASKCASCLSLASLLVLFVTAWSHFHSAMVCCCISSSDNNCCRSRTNSLCSSTCFRSCSSSSKSPLPFVQKIINAFSSLGETNILFPYTSISYNSVIGSFRPCNTSLSILFLTCSFSDAESSYVFKASLLIV